MAFYEVACNRYFLGIFSSDAILLASFCHSVVHLFILCQSHTNLVAFGSCDPTLLLQFTPGDVVLLGTDQAEDICFPAIFTYQGCGETKSSFSLDFRSHSENGGRE